MSFVHITKHLKASLNAVLMPLDLQQVALLINFSTRDPWHGPDVVIHFVRKLSRYLWLHLHFTCHELVCELLQLLLGLRNSIGHSFQFYACLVPQHRQTCAGGCLNLFNQWILAIQASLHDNMNADVSPQREVIGHLALLRPSVVVVVATIAPTLAMVVIFVAAIMVVMIGPFVSTSTTPAAPIFRLLAPAILGFLPIILPGAFPVLPAFPIVVVPSITTSAVPTLVLARLLGLQPLLNLLHGNCLGFLPASFFMGEDEQPLGLAGIALQEAEGAGLMLNASKNHALEDGGDILQLIRDVY
mmetsp:Transcript_21157/g.48997  ORF Transcript_21157/g.48997 Transcript_21157/m.48997 type:complete len:301 (-) Transcript_21157:896-1798(-)